MMDENATVHCPCCSSVIAYNVHNPPSTCVRCECLFTIYDGQAILIRKGTV